MSLNNSKHFKTILTFLSKCFQGWFPSYDWKHLRRDRLLNDGSCRIRMALILSRLERSSSPLVSSFFIAKVFKVLVGHKKTTTKAWFRCKDLMNSQNLANRQFSLILGSEPI